MEFLSFVVALSWAEAAARRRALKHQAPPTLMDSGVPRTVYPLLYPLLELAASANE